MLSLNRSALIRYLLLESLSLEVVIFPFFSALLLFTDLSVKLCEMIDMYNFKFPTLWKDKKYPFSVFILLHLMHIFHHHLFTRFFLLTCVRPFSCRYHAFPNSENARRKEKRKCIVVCDVRFGKNEAE